MIQNSDNLVLCVGIPSVDPPHSGPVVRIVFYTMTSSYGKDKNFDVDTH